MAYNKIIHFLRITKNVFLFHWDIIFITFFIGQVICIGGYWLLFGNPFPIWPFLAGGLCGVLPLFYIEEFNRFKEKREY